MMTKVEDRIFTVGYEDACKDPEYIKLIKEASYYGKIIMKILGENNYLFLKYQESTCLAKGIRLKGAYKLGVEDTLTMPNKMPNKV